MKLLTRCSHPCRIVFNDDLPLIWCSYVTSTNARDREEEVEEEEKTGKESCLFMLILDIIQSEWQSLADRKRENISEIKSRSTFSAQQPEQGDIAHLLSMGGWTRPENNAFQLFQKFLCCLIRLWLVLSSSFRFSFLSKFFFNIKNSLVPTPNRAPGRFTTPSKAIKMLKQRRNIF